MKIQIKIYIHVYYNSFIGQKEKKMLEIKLFVR